MNDANAESGRMARRCQQARVSFGDVEESWPATHLMIGDVPGDPRPISVVVTGELECGVEKETTDGDAEFSSQPDVQTASIGVAIGVICERGRQGRLWGDSAGGPTYDATSIATFQDIAHHL